MHGMHSVVDWLCFAVWEDGVLVRSLSLSPDDGIAENIGTPYEFELPYWAGEHPVEPEPGWADRAPYVFGFVLEGEPRPGDLDPEAVHLHGFRVVDPTGEEQAARQAFYAEFRRRWSASR